MNLLSDLHVPHEQWALDRHFWCLFCLCLRVSVTDLAHVFSVPPTKACLLCATPAMPVDTYRVQSPGLPKIVYCAMIALDWQLRSCVSVEVAVLASPSLVVIYSLCGRKATGSRWDQDAGDGAAPSSQPRRRAWELYFICFSCFSTAELRTLSLWLCSV